MPRPALAVAPLIFVVGLFSAPAAAADPPYRNCKEAHADGRYNIPSDDPAYRTALDRDGDGYACEPYKGR
jgi:hypothetical protein